MTRDAITKTAEFVYPVEECDDYERRRSELNEDLVYLLASDRGRSLLREALGDTRALRDEVGCRDEDGVWHNYEVPRRVWVEHGDPQ